MWQTKLHEESSQLSEMDNVSSLIEKCEAIAIISEDAVNFFVEVLSPYYIILLSPSHSLTGCNICR